MRSILFVACLLLLSAPLARAQQDATATAEALLRSKGLTRSGVLYLLDADMNLPDEMKSLRQLQQQAAAFRRARSALEQSLRDTMNQMSRQEADYRVVAGQLSRTDRTDVQRYNSLVSQANTRISEIRKTEQAAAEIARRMDAMSDPTGEYLNRVAGVVARLDDAAAQYDALAKDPAVFVAIGRINETAVPKVRLGPTPRFTQELAFVRRENGSVQRGAVNIVVQGGVAHTPVTLNGAVTQTMVVDSDAAVVAITSGLAKQLGIAPNAGSAEMTLVTASGQTVQAHLTVLKTVRVGEFTADDVLCAVMPESVGNTQCLLGATFLSKFNVTIDLGGAKMYLSQLNDKSSPATQSLAGATTAPTTQDSDNPNQSISTPLGSLDNWKIASGDWHAIPEGGFQGQGDSKIEFGEPLPVNTVLSFHMVVVNGTRPRVFMEGPDLEIGNEGLVKSIFAFGEVNSVDGAPVSYANGEDIFVSIKLLNDQFVATVNGHAISGACHSADHFRLVLRGGDAGSPGTTKFFGFNLSPLDAQPPASTAPTSQPNQN